MFRANALYEGTYMLGTSIARPLIAKRQIEIAREVGADAVAHGATGKVRAPRHGCFSCHPPRHAPPRCVRHCHRANRRPPHSPYPHPLLTPYPLPTHTLPTTHPLPHQGNDQVRFELGYYALQPDIKVVAPWRLWSLTSRTSMLEYAEKNGE